MAIEPIYGMYVHDEVTDTDGIAKFSSEELEDIRVGADGTTYANAGDAVRGTNSLLKSEIDTLEKNAENLSGISLTPVILDFQNQDGYWNQQDNYDLFSSMQITGATLPVSPFQKYIITSYNFFAMSRVAFFDANNNCVGHVWSSSDNNLVENTSFTVPHNAVKMILQALAGRATKVKLYKVNGYNSYIKDDNLVHGGLILKNIIDDNTSAKYEDVPLTFESQSGYYNANGDMRTYNNISGATVTVNSGEKYLLTSHSFYEVARAVFFDTNDTFVESVLTSNDTELNIDTPITVPDFATKMVLQRYDTMSVELKKETGLVFLSDNPIESILKNKNITVIGDSITEYNWRAKTNWPMYIEEWTGANVQNLGVSGTGFANSPQYVNRISNIQESPDIIGVALSWNDLSVDLPVGNISDTGTASLCGYANDFFDALIAAFPTVPVICYCQGVWAGARPIYANANNWFNALKSICTNKGIPFYGDLFYGSVLRPWNEANKAIYYTSDNDDIGDVGVVDSVHPNSNGHKVIARYLYPKFVANLVGEGLNYS